MEQSIKIERTKGDPLRPIIYNNCKFYQSVIGDNAQANITGNNCQNGTNSYTDGSPIELLTRRITQIEETITREMRLNTLLLSKFLESVEENRKLRATIERYEQKALKSTKQRKRIAK